MSLTNIITRQQDRENNLWAFFSSCFIGNMNEAQRVILFGFYANTYIHGNTYLNEISNEKLLRIVADYENKLDNLSIDQQKNVLTIATQRYLDSLEEQIHTSKLALEQAKIDSTEAEFDAKFDALSADTAAIVTLQERVDQAIAKSVADIALLEAKIQEASLDAEYIEVEISQKELAAAKAALEVLEAGNKALDLQLKIADTALIQTELEYTRAKVNQDVDLIPAELNTLTAQDLDMDAAIIKSATNQAMVDVEVAEMENRAAKVALDVTNKGIDTSLLEVDIEKAKLDTAMVDVDISTTNAQTAKEEAKQIELQTDIVLVTVKIAEIQLAVEEVAAKLKSIEADIAQYEAKMFQEDLADITQQIAQVKHDNLTYQIPNILAAKLALLTDETDILEAKITAVEKYQELENDSYAAKETKRVSEHTYKMTMAALDIKYDLHKAAIKLKSYEKDVIIAEDQQDNQEKQDKERIKVPESNIDAADNATDALVDVAKVMASANIVNNMTHLIGSK